MAGDGQAVENIAKKELRDPEDFPVSPACPTPLTTYPACLACPALPWLPTLPYLPVLLCLSALPAWIPLQAVTELTCSSKILTSVKSALSSHSHKTLPVATCDQLQQQSSQIL